ncbi:MAG: hypothetical protein WAT66_01865, partial [Actinomycetota bacterium]
MGEQAHAACMEWSESYELGVEMKKFFLFAALAASLVLALGGTANAAAGAEVVVFNVNCTLPTFPSGGDSTTCGAGLPDIGVGTAFNGIANPPASASAFYNEPGCAQGNATGTFSIGNASGSFVYARVGALARLTFSGINGGPFTNASGAGLAVFTTGAAGPFVNACLGTPASNLPVSIT